VGGRHPVSFKQGGKRGVRREIRHMSLEATGSPTEKKVKCPGGTPLLHGIWKQENGFPFPHFNEEKRDCGPSTGRTSLGKVGWQPGTRPATGNRPTAESGWISFGHEYFRKGKSYRTRNEGAGGKK